MGKLNIIGLLIIVTTMGLWGCNQTSKSTGVPPQPAQTIPPPPAGVISYADMNLDVAVGEVKQSVIIPASYETVTERVVSQEASLREIYVPAVTRVVDGEIIVIQDASTEYVSVPATFETLTTVQLVEPESIGSQTVQASDVDGLLAVQVATSPFNWDEIEALGGRRPPVFLSPATQIKYNVKPVVFAGRDGADVTLEVVHNKVMNLIESDGDENFQSRLFSHPSGFVILTSPERIDDEAQAIKVDGKRIGINDNIETGFMAFMRGLLRPQPKRFRAIAFTISQTQEAPGEAINTGGDLNQIIASGGFPDQIFKDYLSRYYLKENNFQIIVGVHEFSRLDAATAEESFWDRYKKVAVPFALSQHRSGSSLIDSTLSTGG